MLSAKRSASPSLPTDELRSLDMLKDQFIATVSHELRTPLTSIRLELLLSETDLAEKHRKLLAIVDRNSDRLLRLVGDLLSSRKWMLAS